MAQSVLISGTSGLLGAELSVVLQREGIRVVKLVRHEPVGPDEIRWNPTNEIDAQALEGFDAVVHLAGEPIMGLWTATKRKRIYESRVLGTRTLSDALAQCEHKPSVMISGSAIGIYGDRGDYELTEMSREGEGFLPDVGRAWEEATEPARAAGIRVVNLRTAVVLSAKGGALKQMLLPFKLGLGGRLGSGRQYFSWITLNDWVRAVRLVMNDEPISGPVNVTGPHPVTNSEFTKALASVLRRPAIFPVPAFLLKALPGRMAEEALLASQRVIPQKLMDAGFWFEDPELEAALSGILTV